MLPEITDFAGPLTLVVAGLVLAVLATALTGRWAIPAPALFLTGAAVASAAVPSLRENWASSPLNASPARLPRRVH